MGTSCLRGTELRTSDAGWCSRPPSGCPEPFVARGPNVAGRARPAAVAPIVQMRPITVVARVRLDPDKFHEDVAAQVACQSPGRRLVQPHQRGVDYEALVRTFGHAQVQRRL